MRTRRCLVAAAVLTGLLTVGPVAADPPVQDGMAFEPSPASEPLYGTRPPSADPATQRHVVKGADDVDLFVETWLPATNQGNVPPARVPTILIMTPYVKRNVERYGPDTANRVGQFAAYMTSRGYAVAQHHVRGTGESGGCLEQTADAQIDDGARIVEYLGRDAPWSNGSVGMYGISYDAETQLSVAGRGDKARTQYLKAIVPVSSVAGQYEYSFFDGVPYTGQALLSNGGYLALTSATQGETTTPVHNAQKLTCQPEVLASSGDVSGDVTPYWQVREYRPDADNITAATLYVHGLSDRNVQPIGIAGMFDRIPATTPHKGLFGQWDHNFPDRHPGVEASWARADWRPMVVAWFDRYLKGLDTGVEAWPDVQVQDTGGTWRAESEFPTTGGPVGHLPLSAGGRLGGVTDPTGTTAYTEGADEAVVQPGEQAVFQTEPMQEPLHVTGQPVLDVWLSTNLPDGHIAATLQVIDASGAIVRQSGSRQQEVGTYGFRSLRHLDPMANNHFRQSQGRMPAIDTPLRVPVRFHPADFVVPEGARLRLTVAGTMDSPRRSLPSGVRPTITILHDCAHASALRFLLPTPGEPLLDVREVDEEGPLSSAPGVQPLHDGGGLATAPLCGQPPLRLDTLGPAD